jgi:ubiquinol-cytochrome c reductase cytochrome c1 subunit
MRIEIGSQGLGSSGRRARHLGWLLVVIGAVGASGAQAAEEGAAAGWETWQANTSVADRASVQRGSRNFVNFCLGCHSLQYERWSRLCADLQIPSQICEQSIVPVGDKVSDYIQTTMPAADAETWFGKAPPDLTLMTRARSKNYIYQFLKTFYVDSTRQTGANNLRLPATAMPAVLSDLEGLKRPVYKDVGPNKDPVFDHFEQIAPGRMSPEEYDAFVKDTVNFLDYVSEPTQETRRATGIWVVLFLLVFTWIAWLMKREYWKDVH